MYPITSSYPSYTYSDTASALHADIDICMPTPQTQETHEALCSVSLKAWYRHLLAVSQLAARFNNLATCPISLFVPAVQAYNLNDL